MEQWNGEELDIEEIRAANKAQTISRYHIAAIGFIRTYCPPNTIKNFYTKETSSGIPEVYAQFENPFLEKYTEPQSLSKMIEELTQYYACHTDGQEITEYETFYKRASRRIGYFLDTLLGKTNCVKQLFPKGFSEVQAENLIDVIQYWDLAGFMDFYRGKYDRLDEYVRSFIKDCAIIFVAGCLEDKINLHELTELWGQRLAEPDIEKRDKLKAQIRDETKSLEELILSYLAKSPTEEELKEQICFLDKCIQAIVDFKVKVSDLSDCMPTLKERQEGEFAKTILESIK